MNRTSPEAHLTPGEHGEPASPISWQGIAVRDSQHDEWFIDGRDVLVHLEGSLPKVCVVTGREADISVCMPTGVLDRSAAVREAFFEATTGIELPTESHTRGLRFWTTTEGRQRVKLFASLKVPSLLLVLALIGAGAALDVAVLLYGGMIAAVVPAFVAWQSQFVKVLGTEGDYVRLRLPRAALARLHELED